jgi:hypothetical protein
VPLRLERKATVTTAATRARTITTLMRIAPCGRFLLLNVIGDRLYVSTDGRTSRTASITTDYTPATFSTDLGAQGMNAMHVGMCNRRKVRRLLRAVRFFRSMSPPRRFDGIHSSARRRPSSDSQWMTAAPRMPRGGLRVSSRRHKPSDLQRRA